VKLITDFDLPREAVPTQWLNEVAVWDALLQRMPMTAMVRNVGKMTSLLVRASAPHEKNIVLRRRRTTKSLANPLEGSNHSLEQ
jgi:60 kDa SS-A/Ro ribonucleoprotein